MWEELLAGGMKLEVPEPVVNNAWRSMVVGNYLLTRGDVLWYSAGNHYERRYEAERGDAVRALLLYGDAVLPIDQAGTVDLAGRSGKLTGRIAVQKEP